MKVKLTLLFLLCIGFESLARVSPHWSYDTLNEKATLIVIATPTKVSACAEQATLPNIQTVWPDGQKESVMVKGVETIFEILTVLKGGRDTTTLTLHHYAIADPEKAAVRGQPRLLSFEPKYQKRYLMFLIKEADGRYSAVSGQTDPADSVKELVGGYP